LEYQVGRIYLDKQSRLPVRAEMFSWPAKADDDPPLLEQYTYSSVRINVGLTDADFDRHNPDYRFEDR
jgi:negative regulator of sigma E activity